MGRRFVKLFFLALVSSMAIDAMPWEVLPSDRPKEEISRLLNAAGIWQGQWSMFAPNPSVNNLWLTADVEVGDETTEWSSPYWATENAWRKFVDFRSMNYYNRLNLPINRRANQDLAEYLLRVHGGSQASDRVIVHGNGYGLVWPDPGEMPPADELLWTMHSQVLSMAEEETNDEGDDTVNTEYTSSGGGL